MKHKNDWIALAAALSIGFVAHIALTSDSVVFPAFVGVIMLHCLVSRMARTS